MAKVRDVHVEIVLAICHDIMRENAFMTAVEMLDYQTGTGEQVRVKLYHLLTALNEDLQR